MNKKEFENKMKELNLDKIFYQEYFEEYPNNIYEDIEKNHLYGCYFNGTEYIIYFKDIERGLTKEFGHYKTEDEAYDKLFKKINLWIKKAKKDEK